MRRSICLALAWLAVAQPAWPAPDAAAVREVERARTLLDSWGGSHEPLVEAKVIIDRLLAQDRANVEALKEQARLTIMAGYMKEAYRDYRGHTYTVGMYRPGTLEKAESILLEALRIKADFAGAYVLLGHVYVEREKPQEAAAALRKAEALGTDDPWLHLNWASLHDSRGETAASMERWKRVIALGTADEKARCMACNYLIKHLRKEGKHEEALALYREELARSPDNAWGHGNFANYLRSLGRYEEAIAEARTALRIMDYGMGRRTLATSLYSRWAELLMAGRRGEAQPYFNEAYALHPDLGRIMVWAAPEGWGQGLVRSLAKEKGISIDTRDKDGSTPLLIAVNKNNTEAVKSLLSMGADPNASDQKGWTPLISAADEGNHENVKVLLAAGADRKAMRKGMTAAMHAQAKGYPKLAQQIREFAGTK